MGKVIIFGAGKTGYKLAESLYDEGEDITIIDPEPKKLIKFSERLDVLCIEGQIDDLETIYQAKIKDSNVFIAVGDKDEENIIACSIAKKLKVKKTLARLRNNAYFNSTIFDPKDHGIDHIVNPEHEIALEISKLISIPLAIEVDSVVRDKLSLLKIRAGDFEKKYLKNKLNILNKYYHIIIINSEKSELSFYNNKNKISKKDYIYLIHTTKEIKEVNELFNDKYPKIKNIMIVGGGQTASELLFLLENENMNIKVFEISNTRCSELNKIHKNPLILCGDATDIDILLQEELNKVDCFIALMGDDENNMVLSLFAKHKGVKKVITKISKPYGNELLDEIAITVPVHIDNITVNKIRGYVSMKELIKLETLTGDYEMLEFMITEKSKMINRKIKNKKMFEGAYIVALYRNFELIHKFEEEEILLHDRIIIFGKKRRLGKIEKYFK